MAGYDNQVTVIDIKMPFLSMVVFMVKWAIAAIPALIILAVLSSVLFSMFGRFFEGMGRHVV
jgi:ABC-type multidrug transport system permease subunit